MAQMTITPLFLPTRLESLHMKRILMLCLPPAQGVDVMGPLDVFAIANHLCEQAGKGAPYEIELVTNGRDLKVSASSGVTLLAHRRFAQVRGRIDTLIVAGGPGARRADDPDLLAWIRRS